MSQPNAPSGSRRDKDLLAGVHAFPYTPLTEEGLDAPTFRKNLEALLDAGVHGIVPCGSTGEFAYLPDVQRQRAVEVAIEVVGGRVPVTVMTTAHTTAEVVRHAHHAAEAGASAQLVNLHSYFPMTEDQAYAHLAAAADAAPELPMVVYNSPAVTGFECTIEFLARVADLPQVIGIKESSADVNMASKIVGGLGDRLAVVCGHEALALPLLAIGATGWMSALTNLVPHACVALYEAVRTGELDRARGLHEALQPLANFLQDNQLPVAVKSIAARLGEPASDPIRPLLPLSAAKSEEGIALYLAATESLAQHLAHPIPRPSRDAPILLGATHE